MEKFSRREFVALGLGAAALRTAPASTGPRFPSPAAPDDLLSLTLSEASKRIRAKQVTSLELTQAMLNRIRIYNPKVNANIKIGRAHV